MVLQRFFTRSHGAPVEGKVVKANKRQAFPDGTAEGVTKKFVDPNLLVAGQSYSHFNFIANPSAEILSGVVHASSWGMVTKVDRDNDYFGVPRVTLEMEDGSTVTVGAEDIDRFIPEPIG